MTREKTNATRREKPSVLERIRLLDWELIRDGVFAVIGSAAVLTFVISGYNAIMNNRTVKEPEYELESHANWFGHTERIIYTDGSREARKVHFSGRREVYEDPNGDGFAERIIDNAGFLRGYKLTGVLTKERDYWKNEDRFNEASRALR